MSVRVEFYGVARSRAGVESIDVEAETLQGAIQAAALRLPTFRRDCVDNGRLRDGYIANINGETFTRDPDAALRSGDAVLILSADAGG